MDTTSFSFSLLLRLHDLPSLSPQVFCNVILLSSPHKHTAHKQHSYKYILNMICHHLMQSYFILSSFKLIRQQKSTQSSSKKKKESLIQKTKRTEYRWGRWLCGVVDEMLCHRLSSHLYITCVMSLHTLCFTYLITSYENNLIVFFHLVVC